MRPGAASVSPPPTAFFLVGPTAVGKSAVAHALARREGWAILSADALQVFRGMDIGTAKPTASERAEVTYCGLDLVAPDQEFSADAYLAEARAVLVRHAAEGRKTLVVGGTGLYVKALAHGWQPGGRVPDGVRAAWELALAEGGVEALREALGKRAPARLAALADPFNPRRLLRALEQAELEGPVPAARAWATAEPGVPLAGLHMEPAALRERIAGRVDAMLAGGLEEEVRALLARYGRLSRTAAQAIGYAEMTDVLAGRLTRAAARERMLARTRQLAKRQRTWFRHQVRVTWIDVTNGMETEAIATRVMAHWSEHGPTTIVG